MNYQTVEAQADKWLEPDGSIVTRTGTVIAGPDAGRARRYQQVDPIPDKWLGPDGSIYTAYAPARREQSRRRESREQEKP